MFNEKYLLLQRAIQKSEGGIFKRIDENRELYELLRNKYPQVFLENPWASRWLVSQDRFLTELATLAEQDEEHSPVRPRQVRWEIR